MNYQAEKNNRVFISGEIVTEAEFSHEVYGEGFYEMNVLVKRLSGQGDVLPVTISERAPEPTDRSPMQAPVMQKALMSTLPLWH